MDPCPGAGKLARRQRVRNLATTFLRLTPHGFLTLCLLAVAACAHSPPRPTPVVVVAPAVPPAVRAAATDASTPEPIAPTDLPDAATEASTPAPAAPAAPTAAMDAPTPAPIAPTDLPDAVSAATASQPAMPEAPAVNASPAAAAEEPTQVAGLLPAQYGDLFDRMRAGFKLEGGGDPRAGE